MALAPGAGAPLRVDTGTSTAGVRTPPITLPCASSANAAGWVLDKVKGGGLGGGGPLSTHLSTAGNAAWTTLCWGPLFTGVVQPRRLAAAPTVKASACAGPAISHVRILAVVGWCG